MDTFTPDLVIRDKNGKPIAVVEVKSRDKLPADVATEMRRNMLSRGLPAQIPYFLLLSQDNGYLWRETSHLDPDTPPEYHFPMKNVIRQYSLRNR